MEYGSSSSQPRTVAIRDGSSESPKKSEIHLCITLNQINGYNYTLYKYTAFIILLCHKENFVICCIIIIIVITIAFPQLLIVSEVSFLVRSMAWNFAIYIYQVDRHSVNVLNVSTCI